MKKTYKSPRAISFTIEAESLIASSPVEGGTTPVITDQGDLDAGEAMTGGQSMWDTWSN